MFRRQFVCNFLFLINARLFCFGGQAMREKNEFFGNDFSQDTTRHFLYGGTRR